MDALEQFRNQQANAERNKALGGALGCIGAGIGMKLYDVQDFGIRSPDGLFTKEVDMLGLFRKTKAGEGMVKAHGDVKEAASAVKIAEIGNDFQGSGLGRKANEPQEPQL